jgi:hypothetical protein
MYHPLIDKHYGDLKMKMNHKDALSILDLPISATLEMIKMCYRRACSMFHPDRNPAGLEMMKLVNAAYESLQNYVSQPEDGRDYMKEQNYGDDINDALNAIINLGLHIEVCGSWLWVSGDTRTHKETLKAAGFKWAPKKAMWHFRPDDYKSFSRGKYSMDEIRAIHGSQVIKAKSYTQIETRA